MSPTKSSECNHLFVLKWRNLVRVPLKYPASLLFACVFCLPILCVFFFVQHLSLFLEHTSRTQSIHFAISPHPPQHSATKQTPNTRISKMCAFNSSLAPLKHLLDKFPATAKWEWCAQLIWWSWAQTDRGRWLPLVFNAFPFCLCLFVFLMFVQRVCMWKNVTDDSTFCYPARTSERPRKMVERKLCYCHKQKEDVTNVLFYF